MSKLTLTRGETNLIERHVHLPSSVNDWKITEVRFRVTRHGAGNQDVLIEKTVHDPPGGITFTDGRNVVIQLEPEDLQQLPETEGHFDWTLAYEPGSFNRYVLDYGSLELM